MNRLAFFFLPLGLCFFVPSGTAAQNETVLQKADSAIRQGFPSAVKKPLEKIVADQKAPLANRQAALERLAQAHLLSGTPEDALPLFRSVPPTPALDFWKAQLLLAKGEANEAFAAFLSAADAPGHPFQSEAKIGAARSLFRRQQPGDLARAAELLSAIPPESPLRHQASLDLAQLYLDQGMAEKAVASLGSISEMPARNQMQHNYLLALAQFALGDFDAAKNTLEKTASFSATPPEKITILKADCLNETGFPDRAIDLLEESLQQSPPVAASTAVFQKLDEFYAAQSSPSLSVLRRLANAPTPSPQTANALLFLAKAEARLDHANEAKILYARFLEQFPSHPFRVSATTELASLHLANNEAAKALDLVSADPKDPDASFLRGQALVLLGRYKEAGSAFFSAMKAPHLRLDAAYNGAISELLAGVGSEKNPFLSTLRSEDPSGYFESEFLLADALESARQRLPSAGEKLADLVPVFGNRAATPLAEWHFVQLDTASARSVLENTASPNPDEQRACLEVFLADDENPGPDTPAEALAKKFLKDFPNSEKAHQVRLKLAEIAYRRGDFLTARSNFEQIATESQDPNLSSHAWFLAGKSSSKLMAKDAIQQAMLCYESAAKIGGELAARSRFEQALLLNAQKEPKEAIVLLDRVLADSKDPDLRAAALIEKGDTYFAAAASTPNAYELATKSWQELYNSPQAETYWKEQALTKIGIAHEKFGDKDLALQSFEQVLMDKKSGETGTFWFERAGFEAGRLLEERKAWKEAIHVYQNISESGGPRADEAKKRANRLRLENFLWEE